MLYRKRGKRFYRRAKPLSKANIFSRKSASSQARQINALRKRINTVYKRTRPETQRYQVSDSVTFKNDTFADTYKINRPAAGIVSNMTGNWANLYGTNIRILMEYSDNYQVDAAVDHQRTCSYRFIVWQTVKTGGSQQNIGDVLLQSGSGTDYELQTIRPLKNGVTANARILCDRTYTISYAEPSRRHTINLRKLWNMHKESGQSYPRGDIYFAVVTSGLYWDSTYNQQLKCTWIADTYYADQN